MKWYVFLFYLLLVLYLYIKRKEFEWIGLIFGKRVKDLSILRKIARNKKIIRKVSIIFVLIMFFFSIYSMFLMVNYLIKSVEKRIKKPGVTIIIPGFRAPGTEIEIPLIEGIFAIFILAFVHEISHAVISISRNVGVKSVGYGFFLFLPIAFTELEDEKELLKRPKDAIFIASAGPSANFITSGIFLLLLVLFGKIYMGIVEPIGLEILKVDENAKKYGLSPGMIIVGVNGTEIKRIEDLRDFLSKVKPGEYLEIETEEGKYIVRTKNLSGRPVIGINIKEKYVGKNKFLNLILPVLEFFMSLFYWMYFLNFAIGLLNAYPLPFLDGSLFWSSIFKILIKREKIYNKVMNIFIILWTAVFVGILIVPLVV